METGTKDRGFTLVELMIVIAIIAIIAGIALPNLFASRAMANETAAIATLRAISSAQAQFQGSAKADQDWDGLGEYGSFSELSGATTVRPGTPAEASVVRPPPLSSAFRVVTGVGEVGRSGYLFKVFLPDGAGDGLCPDLSGTYAGVDPDLAETNWCAYAWPTRFGNSGSRTFMINQAGTITAGTNTLYSGSAGGPPPGAGFLPNGTLTSITGQVAIGTVARDGVVWRQVN